MNDVGSGYELENSIESNGFGVKVFVRRPPSLRARIEALPDPRGSVELTPREREKLLLSQTCEEVMRLLYAQDRRLDPDVARRAEETHTAFVDAFTAAGLSPIFVEEIPNGVRTRPRQSVARGMRSRPGSATSRLVGASASSRSTGAARSPRR